MINLSENALGLRSALAAERLLTTSTTLVSLDISNNIHIGPLGCQAVAKGCAVSKTLKCLYLDSVGAGDEGLIAIAQAMYINPSLHLKVLSLRDNSITDAGVVEMVRLTMTTLTAGDNRKIGCCKAPCQGTVSDNVNFKYKSGRAYKKGSYGTRRDRGPSATTSMQSTSSRFESLMLCQNEISDVGASALAKVAHTWPSVLLLSHNKIGKAGAVRLVEEFCKRAIIRNRRCKRSSCSGSHEQAQAVSSIGGTRSTDAVTVYDVHAVHHLNIIHNCVGVKALKKLTARSGRYLLRSCGQLSAGSRSNFRSSFIELD